MFDNEQVDIDKVMDSFDGFCHNLIDEDDYFLDWEDFHKLHPTVAKEDYELGVKQTQEM